LPNPGGTAEGAKAFRPSFGDEGPFLLTYVERRWVKLLQPDLTEFVALSRRYQTVPVFVRVVADTVTPVSAYSLLRGPNAFLLEISDGPESVARHAIIGIDPLRVIRARGKRITIEEKGRRTTVTGFPLLKLRHILRGESVASLDGLPPFYGGAVGYFGYELVRSLERLPEPRCDDLGLPDLLLVFPQIVLVFDQLRRSLTVVGLVRPGADPVSAYQDMRQRVEGVLSRVFAADTAMGDNGLELRGGRDGDLAYHVNWPVQEFEAAVRRVKEYIGAGDVFQVVLSRRFEVGWSSDPFPVYRLLRYLNPSPYTFFLEFAGAALVGSSPEVLVKLSGGKLTARPIAGTRPRGRDEEEDRRLALDLLTDEKERAEHVMLVDLARNDLGRVSRYGTVRVCRYMAVERYSHVMHLVSDVVGEMRPGGDALDALMACFPAGTVTGAPKVRAMEIIAELEPSARGPYAGAVGYIGYDGQMDTCITIRTILFTPGRAIVQAGAGIVLDSVPERETMETVNKAQALLTALETAMR